MMPSIDAFSLISRVIRWLPPKTPGKARLARHILGSYLDNQNAIIQGRDDVSYLTPSLREPVAFYLLIDGVYEVQAVDFVLERLTPSATFIDVGANIGVFTLPVARKIGPRGCVIAIEPSPLVCPYLERNIVLNGLSNVRLVQCAAHNRDGETVPFYEAPVDHFGMGSLGAQFHNSPVPVACRTIDHILEEQRIDKVEVIKVDVEGFEVAVFEGAKKLLTGDNPPLIVFEFCDWAEKRVRGGSVGHAQQLLRDWGYRIWRLGDIVHGRPPLQHVVTTGFDMLVASKGL
jgi:FkbM family methyltransferase